MFIPTQSIVSDEDQDYIFIAQGSVFQKTHIKVGKIVDRNASSSFIEVQSKNLDAETVIILNAEAKMLNADMIAFANVPPNQ